MRFEEIVIKVIGVVWVFWIELTVALFGMMLLMMMMMMMMQQKWRQVQVVEESDSGGLKGVAC